MGRLHDARYFLESLKRKVQAGEGMLAPLLALEAVCRASTLRDFDDDADALFDSGAGW